MRYGLSSRVPPSLVCWSVLLELCSFRQVQLCRSLLPAGCRQRRTLEALFRLGLLVPTRALVAIPRLLLVRRRFLKVGRRNHRQLRELNILRQHAERSSNGGCFDSGLVPGGNDMSVLSASRASSLLWWSETWSTADVSATLSTQSKSSPLFGPCPEVTRPCSPLPIGAVRCCASTTPCRADTERAGQVSFSL